MNSGNSLFRGEEAVLARAETLLAGGEERLPVREYRELLKDFRKLYRQSMRLVKMGDRMQGQLNRLNDRLVKSEEKYRSIFESSIQGIYRSTPEGRFLDLNPAMARIFGYESAETMLRRVTDIGRDLFLCPNRRQKFLQALRLAGMLKDYPLELRRRDGSVIWVEVSTRGVFDPAGNLVELEGLVADVTDKRRMLQELESLARRDGLTSLWNRRYFFELGRREVVRAMRKRSPLALVFFDADHFKHINDSFGHEVGDKVLLDITALGGSLLRQGDIFGRMGGEEFAVLLPDTSLQGALTVAEKMRGCFAGHAVRLPQGTARFTASFGVAILCQDCPCVESLMRVADAALYEAKRSGRNRVCAAQDPGECARGGLFNAAPLAP